MSAKENKMAIPILSNKISRHKNYQIIMITEIWPILMNSNLGQGNARTYRKPSK